MSALVLPLLLVAAAGPPRAGDEVTARKALTALAGAETAAEQAKLCRVAWRAVAQLPRDRQGPWRNALEACLYASLGLPEVRRAGRVAQLEKARKHCQALLAAAGEDCPEGLRQVLGGVLASTLSRLAGAPPRQERGPAQREALRLEQQALAFWRKASDPARRARAAARLALALFQANRPDEATPYCEEALPLYEALPELFLEPAALDLDREKAQAINAWQRDGYRDHAAVYLLLGLARCNAGVTDPARARQSVHLFAESLRLGMRHRDVTAINNVSALLIHPGIGERTGRARKVRYLLGVLEALPSAAANPHWRGRRLGAVKQARAWMHARAREYVAGVFLETGQLLLARHHLDLAEVVAAGLDDRAILPLVRLTQARLYARLGQPGECLKAARRVIDGQGAQATRAEALLLVGGAFESQGDFDRARDYYRWALDLFVRPGSFQLTRTEVFVLARIRERVGLMELEQGRLAEGLAALGEAASLLALAEPARAADLHLERIRLARWAAGTQRYRPATRLVALLQKAKPSPFATALDRRGLGKVAVTFPAARPAEEAQLSREQADLLRRPLTLPVRADLLAAEKASAAALPGLLREIPRYRAGRRGYVEARLALLRGEPRLAAPVLQAECRQLARAAAANLDPELAVEARDALVAVHHEAAIAAVRLGKPTEALLALDAPRDRALLSVGGQGMALWERLSAAERAEAARLDDARTRLDARLLELARQPGERPGLKEAQAERRRLEAAWQALKARLGTAYKAPPAPQPLGAADLPGLLGDGEGLLLFSVGTHDTCAVLAARRAGKVRVTGRVLAVRRTELALLVQALRLGCVRAGGPYRPLARELGRLLLRPFEADLAGLRLLAVAADGPLNGLPFAVLEDDRGRPLLERLALARVPSLALLHRIKAAPRRRAAGALIVDLQEFGEAVWVPASYRGQLGGDALAALVPGFRLARLPGTRREAERLAGLFGKEARRLSNDAAQEDAVRRAAAGKRFLHFATHGVLDPYNPFQSALVLGRPGKGTRGDGFLEAQEVLEDPAFTGAELVSLSACETGLGLTQGGEGVLGLTWAFLARGNRAVLASLWDVADAPTAELMVRFYRAHLGGMDKAQALREAALAVRQQRGWEHPAFWAPFQVTGDWGKP
jgi:CHAT domain-containing protein